MGDYEADPKYAREVEPVVGNPSQVGADAAVSDKKEKPWKRKPKVPSGYESEEAFLKEMRECFQMDLDFDRQNRDEMVEDLRFLAGKQWDESIQQARRNSGKPTLTINLLPAYVEQLVGNRRLVDTGIKVVPDIGGTREVAEIREGLIRSIEKNSRAQLAYDTAFAHQVIGGLGHFQIIVDFAHDDVFEQDIKIAPIADPLAVVWDRNSVDPTGADAERVFVIDRLTPEAFKKRWPDAQPGDFDERMQQSRSGWDTKHTVQIVSYWRILSRERIVALVRDPVTGDTEVEDVTDLPFEQWQDRVVRQSDGTPLIRETQRKYAQMYLCSHNNILEGPYELPIQRVPVIRVPAWELFIEGERIRWGLVRFARDPKKLHNYWRSIIAERLTSVPKAKWLAPDSAVEGYEEAYRKSHLSDDPLLKYNASAGVPPQLMPPVQMEPALLEQAGVASQDIRDVLNIHEANLGAPSNEVSGVAITARQRVGEVGKVLYQDNLNMAIEEAGKVINQLIPTIYDTPRIVKVLGEDRKTEQAVPINGLETGPDITTGKYSVSVTTGPSYVTRRMESREEMMGLANAMPGVFGIAADLVVENYDFAGASEIARRLRLNLPPGVISPEDMSPEEQQMAQQRAMQAQQEAQLQQMVQALALKEKETEIALNNAKIRQAEAQALAAEAQAIFARAQAMRALADIEQAEEETALETMRTIHEVTKPEPSPAGKQ